MPGEGPGSAGALSSDVRRSGRVLLGPVGPSHEVALAGGRVDHVLPRTPDCPVWVPGVPGVGLVDDQVVVLSVVLPGAVDQVLDPAGVHVRVVPEVRAVVDHVVARGQRLRVQLVRIVDVAVDAAVAQVPPPVAVAVLLVHGGVVAVDVDAGVRVAVVVGVVVPVARHGGLRRHDGRQDDQGQGRHQDLQCAIAHVDSPFSIVWV